jgi:hypothetical protein
VNDNTEPGPSQRKREQCLSPDGKWRSFPKVPNLLQYVSNSNYYDRIKVSGKTIRKSLNTDVWTTAKLRLHDFLKKQKDNSQRIVAPQFTEAVACFKQEIQSNSALKPQSKRYRLVVPSKIGNVLAGGLGAAARRNHRRRLLRMGRQAAKENRLPLLQQHHCDPEADPRYRNQKA